MNSIKFEIINGTLCRMVEPTPLQPDSPMPCVVRLIQDETPMGLYHKDLFRVDKDEYSPKICDEVRDIKDLSDSNRGSVIHSGGIVSAQYYHFEIIGYPVADGSAEWALWQRQNKKSVITDTGVVMHYHYDDETCAALLRAYPTGWQLYEPETEPCDVCAGIGMISCEACNATGRVAVKPEPEPAYAVGDWVELNSYQNHHGKIVEMFDAGMAEIHGTRIHRTLPTFTITGLSGEFYHNAITRILKPSEVVVDFGSGIKGTIVGCNNVMPIIKVLNGVDWIASIMISALDTATASKVKELLEKQGEAK